jgi:dienelactone hydrolase
MCVMHHSHAPRWPWFALPLLVLAVAPSSEGQQSRTPPSWWATLKVGRYGHVGHVRLPAADDSKDSIDVWYPAMGGGTPMRLIDYAGGREYAAPLVEGGIPLSAMDSLLRQPAFARSSARARSRHFPAVLIAQGNSQTAIDQAVLSEFLASNGYVVVSMPAPTLARPMTSPDQAGGVAALQASQLMRALSRVTPHFHVNRDRVALIGHSFGARSALLIAMQSKTIKAFVSLDGGIGTANGLDQLRAATGFDVNAFLPPTLHVYERLDAFMSPDFAFLKSLRTANLTLRETRAMHHVHFTTIGFLSATDPRIALLTHAGADIGSEVAATANAVVQFLDHRLKH